MDEVRTVPVKGCLDGSNSGEVERTREGIEYSRVQQDGLDRGEVDRKVALLPTTGTSSTIQLINRVEWSKMGRILGE